MARLLMRGEAGAVPAGVAAAAAEAGTRAWGADLGRIEGAVRSIDGNADLELTLSQLLLDLVGKWY